jgi:hypothetical protein
MLVALARKLAIALWRYVETGLIPNGAVMTAPTSLPLHEAQSRSLNFGSHW